MSFLPPEPKIPKTCNQDLESGNTTEQDRKAEKRLSFAYNEGRKAGKSAEEDGRVEKLSFQYSADYVEGYYAGVLAEQRSRNPGSIEARNARRVRRAKDVEIAKRARIIKEAKAMEERRIKRVIEKAHRDAVEFHKALDKSSGASEEEIKYTFGMRMSFGYIARAMEVLGAGAKLDQRGRS